MYLIIRCPRCGGFTYAKENQESKDCPRCGKTSKLSKMKKYEKIKTEKEAGELVRKHQEEEMDGNEVGFS